MAWVQPLATEICAATAMGPMLAGRWSRTNETESGAGKGSIEQIFDLRTTEEERVSISPLASEAKMLTGLFH